MPTAWAVRRRQYDHPVARFPRVQRLVFVLRTSIEFVGLGVGSSVFGSGVVGLLLALKGIPSDLGNRAWILATTAAAYVAGSLVVGALWTAVLQRRTAVWLTLGRSPKSDEARRAMRLPADMATVSSSLWLIGTVLITAVAAVLGSPLDALGIGLAIALGGLTTVGVTYLAAEWLARPIMTLALEVTPPQGALSATVRTRLILTWALASGVPLVGVLLVLSPPNIGTADPTASLILLACIGLVVGAVSTALLAGTVAAPIRRLRVALDQVAGGRTDVSVPVNDGTEIGMLQTSVNQMVAGLRERQRMRDLFDRHVGSEVARHALETGASLSGEVREVTALFVDVVDSTSLAYRLPPEAFVDVLNRFFAGVVDAVNVRGGLVNKFQGDAALCIFGAPTRLAAPATSALSAARAIRDAVRDLGELDLGIGVATGPVFAGQLGSSSRFEYTVIGDAVNEAARLTDSAKAVPGRILASEAVINSCTDAERRYWTRHESIRLRGRNAPTATWVDSGSAAHPDGPSSSLG